LINDLLDQAQMEAGKLTIQMAPLRPAELLENLHSVMDQNAHDKNLRLTSEIDDSLHKWGIEVSDTGSGIPESELPYIFDTFRQVEGTATRVHGGFGLGLSIVKQLVNLMSGEIVVKSKKDVGSIFTITLPLVVPEQSNEKWRIG
jgi:signal transduction histidine kinase